MVRSDAADGARSVTMSPARQSATVVAATWPRVWLRVRVTYQAVKQGVMCIKALAT